MDAVQVEPTETATAHMESLKVPWYKVEQAALDPEVIRPSADHDPQKRFHDRDDVTICVARHQHAVELLVVLAVYSRERGEGAPQCLQPVQRSQRRYAGAGNARGVYPTSFEELVSILNGMPHVTVEKVSGAKHPVRVVTAKGDKLPIPVNGNDWRAVKNMIVNLRRMGVDPKRTFRKAG